MNTRFFNYLRFSRAERNGTLMLILFTTGLFLVPELTRWLRLAKNTDFTAFRHEIQSFRASLDHPDAAAASARSALFFFDPNTASFDDFVQLGLSERVANIICNYRDKGGDFREPSDFQKIWSLKPEDYERLAPYIRMETGSKKTPNKPRAELFAFDPNTAPETDLLRLGLSARAVKSILNYRSKGGKFRKAEDLGKIYTIGEEDFVRVAPFVSIGSSPDMAEAPVAHAGFAVPKGPLDINKANVEAWMGLPGIGEGRARQLINYREKLGGFQTIEQVAELYGLPDSVFQRIRPRLALHTAEIRKTNLNTVSADELCAHPYISKKQAALIVAYREQHGSFSSPEDLRKMRAFSDQAWLDKVLPYLGVE